MLKKIEEILSINELFIYLWENPRVTMIKMKVISLIIISISLVVPTGVSFFKEVQGIKYWCDESVLICTGDETDDDITGNNNNNIIYGWTGSDYLRGMGGDDIIFGGEGADTIIGDLSSEVFNETKYGKDVLIGGLNDDILVGYKGNDEFYGGEGDDWLRDFASTDSKDVNKFFGENGNDLLVGGSAKDIFQCGDGMDVVVNLNTTQGDISESDCEVVIKERSDYKQNNQELFKLAPIENETIDLGQK